LACTVLCLLALTVIAPPASAQTWTGLADADWGNPLNWSPVGVPAAGANVTMSGGGNTFISLNGNRTVGLITFDSTDSFGISDNTLTLANLTSTNSATFYQIASNVNLSSGTSTWNIGGPAPLNVNGVILGSTLVKTGAGELALNATNNYKYTTINAGTLSVSSDENLGIVPGGATAGVITFGGGTLHTHSTFAIDSKRGIALNAAGGTFLPDLGATLSYGGVIAGAGALTKAGGGTLTLSGSNTYTGGTIVNAGALSISANANLGATPGAATPGSLTLANGGALQTTATMTLSSNRGIALSTGGGRLLTDSGTTLTYGGSVAGAGSLTKDGAGTLTLTGANTLTGGLTVSAGTLQVTAGTTTSSSTQVAATGTLQLEGGAFAAGGNVNVANGGALNVITAGVINGNGETGAAGTFSSAGGAGSSGKSITSLGTLTMSGASPVINLTGGAGGAANTLQDTFGGGMGGTGGALSIAGGTAALSGASAINLRGGSGGAGTSFLSGSPGGAGGTLGIAGGALSLAGDSVIDLSGGPGGSGITGGGGGAGGAVNLSAGALNMTGGKILLAGGASGLAAITGAPGTLNVTGGTFNFTAGTISGDATAPTGLAAATMNISGGTMNVLSDFDDYGVINVTGAGTIAQTVPASFSVGSSHGVEGTLNISASGSVSLGSVGVMSHGHLNLSGGTLTATSIKVFGGSEFNFTGGVLHATSFTGSFTNAGGTLAPGASTGTMSIINDYTQTAGVLQIEIAGASAGQFDALSVTGNVTLGGVLDVDLLSGFTPALGQSWKIIDVGGALTGSFAGLLPGGVVGNFGGTILSVNYNGGDGNDVFLRTSRPGDFDFDGNVDGQDFLLWQRGASPNPLSAADLADWQMNFGATSIAATATTVPEPAAGVLAMLAAVALLRPGIVARRNRATSGLA
jgi:autotransporter-associated beta strand protein